MKTRRDDEAFSLIEVTLALGVAAFSLLTIFALLPIGVETNRNATEQTATPKILSAVATDLRSTPRIAATSQLFDITIPGNTASDSTTLFFTHDGEHSPSLAPNSRYRVVVTFAPNDAGSHAATFATLKLTWPAVALPGTEAGAVEAFVALARN